MLDTTVLSAPLTPPCSIPEADVEAASKVGNVFDPFANSTVDSLLDLFQKNDEIAQQARRGSARRASVMLAAMIEAEVVQPELSSYSSVILSQAKAPDGSAQTAMDTLTMLIRDASVQPSTVIVNAVLNAHAKCRDGSANVALRLLRDMRQQLQLDAISYNTVINCFAKCNNGSAAGAMNVYDEMLKAGVIPTVVTYYSLLNAQRTQQDGTSQNALRVLDHVVRTLGMEPDYTMLTTVIGLQSRCTDGSGRAALALLGRMKQSGMQITAKLLNCVIDSQAKNEDGSARIALSLLDSMKQSRLAEVRPSIVTYTSVIDCLAKCRDGDGRTAVALLEEMITEGLTPNHVTYLCCLNAQARHGSAKMALQLLSKLRKQGLSPTHSQFNSVLSACTNATDGSARSAIQVLNDMDDSGAIPSALSFSMCIEAQATHEDGTAFHAYELVNRMLKRDLRVDGLTFNHAISAQTKKGDGTARAAVALFHAMAGMMEPNLYSYNIVLNACATARPAQLGLATDVFNKMLGKGFSPNEYTMSALLRATAFCEHPDPATARRWFAEHCTAESFDVNDHIARALRAALPNADEAEDLLARAGNSSSPPSRRVIRRKSGSPTLDRRVLRSRNSQSQSADWRGTPARKGSWRGESPPCSPAASSFGRQSPSTPREAASGFNGFNFPPGPKSRSMSAPFITGLSGASSYTPPSSPGLMPSSGSSPRMSLVDKIRSIKEKQQQQQRSSSLLSPDFFSSSSCAMTPISPTSSTENLSDLELTLGPVQPRLSRRRSTRSSLRAVEGVVREPSGPDGTKGFGRRRSSMLLVQPSATAVVG